LPKEDHLPDRKRRDIQVKKGDPVEKVLRLSLIKIRKIPQAVRKAALWDDIRAQDLQNKKQSTMAFA
jgi:hypothetical protein